MSSLPYLPLLLLACAGALADPPVTSYIFPAGGQQGVKTTCRVGGLYLSAECGLEMVGPGVEAPPRIKSIPTLTLVGPYHHNPIAQQGWEYPQDMAAEVKIAADAPLGPRHWYCSTAEGVTQLRLFLVGDLPEIVEEEEKTALSRPQEVRLPVTINGRIYPRADLDEYGFEAAKGQLLSFEAFAERLGHKLDPKLEIRDASGQLVAENDDHFGRDSLLLFTAPSDGKYVLRIHDIAFEGDQDYVYRLSIRAGPYITHSFPAGGRRGTKVTARFYGPGLGPTGFVDREITLPSAPAAMESALPGGWHLGSSFELGEEPEVIEKESNDGRHEAQPFTPPCVINGQILAPGDVDEFTFRARQGEKLDLELRGRRLGSPITAVWSLLDASGKELLRKEGDDRASFAAPVEGDFTLRVGERHQEALGGTEYIYRLSVRLAEADFRLALDRDALGMEAGQSSKVKLNVTRLGGFDGEIQLAVTNLPPGVSMANAKVPAGQSQAELSFTASKDASFGVAQRAVILGTGILATGATLLPGQRLLRAAAVPAAPGARDLFRADTIAVTVTHPPLFTISTEEVYDVAHRGATFVQKYKIERKPGFDGEVVLSFADRQARYLQGATGPVVVVKPGEADLSYPVFFPETMDLNRTARIILMGTAKMADSQGRAQYLTHATQKQLIVRVTPALLSLSSDVTYLEGLRGQALQIPLHVSRGPELKGPVTVEAVLPPGMKGITALPITMPEGQEAVNLSLQFAANAEAAGQENLTFRATSLQNGYPVVAESSVEIELKP